jgi:hypothetical protein
VKTNFKASPATISNSDLYHIFTSFYILTMKMNTYMCQIVSLMCQ